MRELATLRITFIAGTLGQGGAERQLYYIVTALHECGARVHVLCLTRGEFWEERICARGVPVSWVGQHAARSHRLIEVVRVLRRHAPDIVQSHHFYTNLYASAGARMLSLHDVGAIRNDVLSEVRDNGRVLGSLSLRVPRLVVANSRQGIANALRLGVPSARLRLLDNVVDERLFSPALESRTRPATLLAVGRLVKQKRLDRFLWGVAKVRSTHAAPVRALIIGEGPDRGALERLAAQLGLLPDVVEFRGAVADPAPVYREADILVLTSDHEGTPNVVLEAMASGLPVVATKVGGVADLVEDGSTGFMAPPENDECLHTALLQLLANRSLRLTMGERGRRRILDRHSLDRLPRRLAALYESA